MFQVTEVFRAMELKSCNAASNWPLRMYLVMAMLHLTMSESELTLCSAFCFLMDFFLTGLDKLRLLHCLIWTFMDDEDSFRARNGHEMALCNCLKRIVLKLHSQTFAR